MITIPDDTFVYKSLSSHPDMLMDIVPLRWVVIFNREMQKLEENRSHVGVFINRTFHQQHRRL